MGRVVVRTREKNSLFNRGVGSGGRTKTGIEEERVKGAPGHPVSVMRGGSTPK